MFCSKCGKTIPAGAEQCPHCSAVVGQSRFEGVPYTSAQPRFEAGNRSSYAQSLGYTRTTYTGMDPEREEAGEVDARTTYRPAYEGASAPDDIRREMRSDLEGAAEEPVQAERPDDEQYRRKIDLLDKELELEDVDFSQLKSRPIVRHEQTGISPGVSDYISRLEANQERRANRKGFSLRKLAGRNAPEAENDGAQAENVQAEQAPDYDDYGVAEDDRAVDYEGDPDQEDYEELRSGVFSKLDLGKLTKIALALVLVAGLFVAGVTWIRHISKETNSAPIEGVTLDFYNSGIAQIEQNASADHIQEIIALYGSEGLISVNKSLSDDALAIASLMPENPDTNDQTFLAALNKIETNIGNAVTMDVLSSTNASETASQESVARWKVVNDSIAKLKSAKSAVELTGIINGAEITVAATPTPAPTQRAYTTLSNGDKGDAVLTLQNRLYELGFFMDDRDGAFGNKTMTALKIFQQAVGLEATGIADSKTQAALYSETAPHTQFAPGATATASATAAAQ